MVKTLRVVGLPEAWSRPIPLPNGGMHSPKSKWHVNVFGEAICSRPFVPFSGPVALTAVFMFPLIKKPAHKLWKATRPDVDNLIKTIMDALTEAKWWGDDGIVVRLVGEKRFVAEPEPPGAVITVQEL